MKLNDDKILYQEFLNGNEKAFEEIMNKYVEKLIYFIYSFIKNIEISKDISQDTFVYILANREKYKFQYSFSTYLYMIAKSKTLNYMKREKKRVELMNKYYYNEELLIDIENIVFDNIEKQKLRKAILDLPKLQRSNDLPS